VLESINRTLTYTIAHIEGSKVAIVGGVISEGDVRIEIYEDHNLVIELRTLKFRGNVT
jgi:hypothetical protein